MISTTSTCLEELEFFVEFLVISPNESHENVRVPSNVLGDGVVDQGCTQIQRFLEIWGHECVVNNHDEFVGFGNVCNCLEVNDFEGWVGWGLNPEQLRGQMQMYLSFFCDLLFQILEIFHGMECGLNVIV